MITVVNWSPQTACIWGILVVIATSWFVKGKGMRWRNIADALAKGAETMPQLGVTICMAAILVGSIQLTGVGYRMAAGIMMMMPGLTTDLIGLGLGVLTVVYQLLTRKLQHAAASVDPAQ